MRFIQTNAGDYLAVDTIAKIGQVEVNYILLEDEAFPGKLSRIPNSVSITITTKRGEQHPAKVTHSEFQKLINGGV